MIYKGPSLIPGGRSAEVNENFERRFKREYKVITNNINDDEFVVTSTLGINIHSNHPNDAYSKVTGIEVTEGARVVLPDGTQGCEWHIIVSYGPFDPLYFNANGNPLNAPVRYHFESEKYEKICSVAFDPTTPNAATPTIPVLNNVGDLFNPPLMMDSFRGMLVVNKNIAPSPGLLLQLEGFSNCINANLWNTFPAKSLKLEPIKLPELSLDQLTGIEYYMMEFSFAYKPDLWTEKVYNTGRRQIKPTAQKPFRLLTILDDSAQPLDDPSFLDNAGKYLAPPVNPLNIVTLTFEKYRQIDFTALNLPGDLIA